MDITKAKRILAKINVLVDNYDGSYSNLEQDLLKSYIEDLYKTFGGGQFNEKLYSIPPPAPKIQADYDLPASKSDSIIELENDSPEVEAGPVPAPKAPMEEKIVSEPMVDLSAIEDEMAEMSEIVEEKIDVSNPVTQMEEVLTENSTEEISETLQGLFTMKKGDDIQSKLSAKPIDKIEQAMGLNERIFTINELFGADQSLFQSTVSALNGMGSFEDAKQFLISGVATTHNWADESKLKKAEKFILLVSRKFA